MEGQRAAPATLPQGLESLRIPFSDIPSSMSQSYWYLNQAKCCFIILGTREKWNVFAFPSLYFIQRSDPERTLLQKLNRLI